VALLSYDVPRTEWRAAVHRVRAPVLYVVRPRFAVQADALAATHPAAETRVYDDAGHALFVDEAERFNADLADFLRRRVDR
jgi:microsomal epoxide hydrolase